MFGLFKKNEEKINVVDKIWISNEAKWNGCIAEMKKAQSPVFIAWFEDSIGEFRDYAAAAGEELPEITLAQQCNPSHFVSGSNFFLIEHHPLLSKENEFFRKLKTQEVTVFSSLTEPIFTRFGGDKIIQLMKQMGMKEDEAVEHTMISKAIRNAQEKIEKKLVTELSAHSQQAWMEINLPA